VFAALTDSFCEPAFPLPAVGDSDAVAFMGELASGAPRINRAGFRVILRLVDVAPLVRGHRRRFRRLSRSERVRFLHGLDKSRWFVLRVAARLLKTLTVMSYYGDPAVLRATGYDPDAVVARARALRAEQQRP
jgi:hypothetical protein